jgi:tetratricopeptide (TPR) repeat protein
MLIARVEAVDSASKDCMAADADRSIAGCTAVLRRRKETRSNRAKALYNRGIALQDKGDLDRALVDFNEAIQLNPKDANAFNNRGITHKDKGDLDRTLADFNAAIRLGPTDPDGYFGRGSVHERTRDYEAALVDYETALKINARHANALKGSDRVRALVQQR